MMQTCAEKQSRRAVPATVHTALLSPGRPLDPATRGVMESRFAHDFSRVRIHTDDRAAASARAVQAHAYTVGEDVVFARGRFEPSSEGGRQLIAHELAHVVEQSSGPHMLARQPTDAPEQKAEPKAQDPKQAAPKREKCHTGCAMRWGQDTVCSKFGFVESLRDPGDNVQKWKRWKAKDFQCCNSWPYAVEQYARNQLGLSGAASCPYQQQIATVSMGGSEVDVLCSDAVGSKFGEKPAGRGACKGTPPKEVIELSPKAMRDLSGQTANAIHVRVCYSGAAQPLCPNEGRGGPGKDGSFPEAEDCITRGCQTDPELPKLKDTGWRRV